ncbi:MAG: S1 RNA-binding domain-containing protein [Faecalibacterium sp.]|nr:S1 RNA-binding domain-containing protein [Ruminococcus sp.]MCM1392794.1 S1 RNA-binding domain-containing protein [Ruminococcus sp.]MCM1485526.1 S1 RNA-binding domain-containing protein [Faecalibacterium sp.]
MLEIGAIVEGKVTGLTGFGAFVALPDGSSGMVHISEVSNAYVNEIKDFLSEGQEVKVKVIGINDEGKISLSIKKATEQHDAPRQRNNRGGQRRSRQPNAWQGQPSKPSTEGMSFEDMMARFKQVSDEKMTDLKRSGESKHGGGYSRRGNKNNH